jgi:hypothetical protein
MVESVRLSLYLEELMADFTNSTSELAEEFMDLDRKSKGIDPGASALDWVELVSLEARKKALASEICLRGSGRTPRPNDVSPILLKHLGLVE